MYSAHKTSSDISKSPAHLARHLHRFQPNPMGILSHYMNCEDKPNCVFHSNSQDGCKTFAYQRRSGILAVYQCRQKSLKSMYQQKRKLDLQQPDQSYQQNLDQGWANQLNPNNHSRTLLCNASLMVLRQMGGSLRYMSSKQQPNKIVAKEVHTTYQTMSGWFHLLQYTISADHLAQANGECFHATPQQIFSSLAIENHLQSTKYKNQLKL